MSGLETPAGEPQRPGGAGSDDPIASLHRMSTTAGVGAGDYVAINAAAVTAALLGLASALALWVGVFLALSVAGIVCGLVALRQIRNSNGTQGGTWLAVAGLGLSLLFAGTTFAREWRRQAANREDRQQVEQVVAQLEQRLKEARWAEVYAMFDGWYRSRVTPEQFEARFGKIVEALGQIQSARTTGVIEFSRMPDGQRTAETKLVVQFARLSAAERYYLRLHKEQGGGWRLRFLELVPPESPAPPGPRPG
mgnify:CR=1 FL=1